MKIKFFILFMGLAFFVGCSKKKEAPELVYTPEEFNKIMETVSVSADKDTTHAINFSDYAAGADKINSKPLVYERLSFAVIAFETETQARDEAKRLGQYYSRNWLFDKVEGEPILEDLVLVKFHAVNPKRRIQRTPKIIPPAGHADASGGGGH